MAKTNGTPRPPKANAVIIAVIIATTMLCFGIVGGLSIHGHASGSEGQGCGGVEETGVASNGAALSQGENRGSESPGQSDGLDEACKLSTTSCWKAMARRWRWPDSDVYRVLARSNVLLAGLSAEQDQDAAQKLWTDLQRASAQRDRSSLVVDRAINQITARMKAEKRKNLFVAIAGEVPFKAELTGLPVATVDSITTAMNPISFGLLTTIHHDIQSKLAAAHRATQTGHGAPSGGGGEPGAGGPGGVSGPTVSTAGVSMLAMIADCIKAAKKAEAGGYPMGGNSGGGGNGAGGDPNPMSTSSSSGGNGEGKGEMSGGLTEDQPIEGDCSKLDPSKKYTSTGTGGTSAWLPPSKEKKDHAWKVSVKVKAYYNDKTYTWSKEYKPTKVFETSDGTVQSKGKIIEKKNGKVVSKKTVWTKPENSNKAFEEAKSESKKQGQKLKNKAEKGSSGDVDEEYSSKEPKEKDQNGANNFDLDDNGDNGCGGETASAADCPWAQKQDKDSKACLEFKQKMLIGQADPNGAKNPCDKSGKGGMGLTKLQQLWDPVEGKNGALHQLDTTQIQSAISQIQNASQPGEDQGN